MAIVIQNNVLTCCSSRTKADKARRLFGWEPKYGEEEFLEDIDDVVTNMLAQEG